MYAYIDKLLLVLCCSIMLSPAKQPLESVIALLLAVTIGCLSLYLTHNLYYYILSGGYYILCIFFPTFSVFLPILYYDMFRRKGYFLLIVGIPLLVIYQGESSGRNVIALIILIVIAMMLSYKTEKIESLQHSFKMLRDNSTELTLRLKKANHELIDRQDYEIHLATLSERNRIAREIHDNVGHMLSRCLLQIGALLAITKDSATKEHLTGIKSTLSEAMTSIRSSVHDLHDETIDLHDVIISMTQHFSNYEITLDYDISPLIDSKVKYCFITTLKEALSNVVKHSNATKISITAREHPAFYQLLIHDNGINSTPIAEGGMGLDNMQERVRSLNGTLRVDSDANGFRIFISIPKALS